MSEVLPSGTEVESHPVTEFGVASKGYVDTGLASHDESVTDGAAGPSVSVRAGVRSVFVYWSGFDANVSGHGYFQLQVSEASDFVALVQDVVTKTTWATIDGLTSGTTYYFRVRAIDAAGNKTAWAATVSSTTDLVGGNDLADGTVDYDHFFAGLEPIRKLDTLPILPHPSYPPGAHVFLTTDGKLYRNVADAWTVAVAAADITGQLTNSQLAAGSVDSTQLVDLSVVTAKLADASVATGKLDAGAVTAAKIAANTITANEIAADTITAAEIAAGTITAIEIAAGTITANEIAAGAVTAAKLQVSIGGGNLVRNAGFESGTKLRWTNGVNATFAVVSTTARPPGTYGLKVTGKGLAGSPYIVSDPINAEPGEEYSASVYCRRGTTGTTLMKLDLRFYDSGGVQLGSTAYATTVGSTSEWTRVSKTVVAPANTATMKAWLVMDALAVDEILYFDDVQVEVGDVVTSWKPTIEELLPGVIVTDMLAASAVTAAKIAAGTITANEIATDTITANQIAAGTITAAEIAASTITAAELASITIETGKYIQSTNYVAGNDGFRLNADGTAEFSSMITSGGGVKFGEYMSGHYGISLDGTHNNAFLRRESDGNLYFRMNSGGATALDAIYDNVAGTMSLSIKGGSLTSSTLSTGAAGGRGIDVDQTLVFRNSLGSAALTFDFSEGVAAWFDVTEPRVDLRLSGTYRIRYTDTEVTHNTTRTIVYDLRASTQIISFGSISTSGGGDISSSGQISSSSFLTVGNHLICEGRVAPQSGFDNTNPCGTSSLRWTAVYAVDGTINTSDIRYKDDVSPGTLGLGFIRALEPIEFVRPGRVRRHQGFAAQQTLEAARAVGADDFAGYVDPAASPSEDDLLDLGVDGSDEAEWLAALESIPKGLRYHEFVAPLVTAVQELADHVDALTARVVALESP